MIPSDPSQCADKLLRLYRALVESEITVIVEGLDWEMWVQVRWEGVESGRYCGLCFHCC
jgi:hypothetical protein